MEGFSPETIEGLFSSYTRLKRLADGEPVFSDTFSPTNQSEWQHVVHGAADIARVRLVLGLMKESPATPWATILEDDWAFESGRAKKESGDHD